MPLGKCTGCRVVFEWKGGPLVRDAGPRPRQRHPPPPKGRLMKTTIKHASIAEKDAHEKALAGLWGPIVRLQDKDFLESMHLTERFGAVLEAASRDGAAAKPTPCFARPYFSHSGM